MPSVLLNNWLKDMDFTIMTCQMVSRQHVFFQLFVDSTKINFNYKWDDEFILENAINYFYEEVEDRNCQALMSEALK